MDRRGALELILFSPVLVRSLAKNAIAYPEKVEDKLSKFHSFIKQELDSKEGEEAETEIIKYCNDLIVEYGKKGLADYILASFNEFKFSECPYIDYKLKDEITLDDYLNFGNNGEHLKDEYIYYGFPINMRIPKYFVVVNALMKTEVLLILLNKNIKLNSITEDLLRIQLRTLINLFFKRF